VTVTALYVPGDRPDRFDKAAASGADAVILDLEDAIAPARRAAARDHVAAWLASRPDADVQVRIGSLDDLAALPSDVAIRLPKVESPVDVDAVGERDVHALIETALGVERAYAIASHPRVVSIGLGEADLAADLGIVDESALAWIRVRAVVAARAAGLPAPMMSAYTDVADLDGLAVSCALGRSLGMVGRTAIHPRQLPVIAAAFAPTDAELAWAKEVLAVLDGAATGVATLASGAMVDAAMARRARTLLDAHRVPARRAHGS
jgi:citrate lyase subunit beta / citryl-CoA lyase